MSLEGTSDNLSRDAPVSTVVSVDLSPKKDWKQHWFVKYVWAAVVVFFVTILLTYVSVRLNQFWAAWLYAIPFILFPVMVSLYYFALPGTSNRHAIAGLAGSITVALFIVFGWTLSLYLLLTYSNLSFWASMGYSLGIWALLSVVFFFIMCGSPLVKWLKSLPSLPGAQDYGCLDFGSDVKAT